MSTSRVLYIAKVVNLAQLIHELDSLSKDDLEGVPDSSVHVFGANGEALRIRLIVDTLTDGSEVYNVSIE